MSVFGDLHSCSQSTFMSSASSISLWKLYITSCLLILANLLLGVVLRGVFVIILCGVALDGVLGGVMGTVWCIVFGILSGFFAFHMRWNIGYNNLWQYFIFRFFEVAMLCYSFI